MRPDIRGLANLQNTGSTSDRGIGVWPGSSHDWTRVGKFGGKRKKYNVNVSRYQGFIVKLSIFVGVNKKLKGKIASLCRDFESAFLGFVLLFSFVSFEKTFDENCIGASTGYICHRNFM